MCVCACTYIHKYTNNICIHTYSCTRRFVSVHKSSGFNNIFLKDKCSDFSMS